MMAGTYRPGTIKTSVSAQEPWDTSQIPLVVKYDAKPIWPALNKAFGTCPTGAALIVAAVEAALIGNAVSYSRNRNWYSARDRHPLLTYRRTVSSVDDLDRMGLIRHWKQVPGGLGWQSAFTATGELIEAVMRITDFRALRYLTPPQLTILRNMDGHSVNYRLTRAIERQDRRTASFNEAITGATVRRPDTACNLAAPLARIFNQNLKRGGRFYALGTSWQNIKSTHRASLTIDGEPVVELDYATLHPAILYHEAGASLPSDSYEIEGWPRDQVKVAMLTLINAKTEAAARLSIEHNVMGDGDHGSIRKASDLIRAIKRKHAPIVNAFHSDAGARLMWQDSGLAEDVMTQLMTHKGIVVLPVHDSFLVPASKRDELEEAMLKAAYEVAGIRAIVKEVAG